MCKTLRPVAPRALRAPSRAERKLPWGHAHAAAATGEARMRNASGSQAMQRFHRQSLGYEEPECGLEWLLTECGYTRRPVHAVERVLR